MNSLKFLLILSLMTCAIHGQNPVFTKAPALTRSGAGGTVEFTVDRATDVAVSIVRLTDSTVIRRLAAGLLGPKAPAPLLKDSLHQVISWDGSDDFGNPVPAGVTCQVRVRAGMSAQLAAIVGDNPSSFLNGGNGSVSGIAVGPDGSIYIYGAPTYIPQQHYSQIYMNVRQFDGDGNYVKTVYPFAANLPPDKLKGWSINRFQDGSYSPQNSITSAPGISWTRLAVMKQNGSLHMVNNDGDLIYGGMSGIEAFKTDGTKDSGTGAVLVASPAMPKNAIFGNAHLTAVPGSADYLVSGVYEAYGTVNQILNLAPDTGFYRDGRVFRINPATHVATVFISLDSVPTLPADRSAKFGGLVGYSAIHGTAVDGGGRVYVCDRLHGRIGIYSSSAAYLGGIPCPYPSKVAVSRSSGAVYVLTCQQQTASRTTGTQRLLKFAAFDAGAAKICSTTLATGVGYYSTNLSLGVVESPGKTNVWAATSGATMKIYRDEGTSFSVFKDFTTDGVNSYYGVDRLAVDRRNETVYFNNGTTGLYKVENWSDPKALPCSTTARKFIMACDMAIGANNYLYIFDDPNIGSANYKGPILRYTLDHLHAPAVWANSGTNVLTPRADFRWIGYTGVRGLAVGWDGRVALMGSMVTARDDCHAWIFADSSHRDTAKADRNQFYPFPGTTNPRCGGVRFDKEGNLYAGALYRPADHLFSAGWAATDKGYLTSVGSVIKVNKADSAYFSTATTLGGAAKVYAEGVGPFSNDPYPSASNCVCRSPRFDIDGYGRLFLTDAVTNRVSIVDNEGNVILRFGKYGNADSRGGLNGRYPNAIASPSIPLGWPTSAMASEDYVYVSDLINSRLVRVKMNYAIDNMPGITERLKADEKAALLKAPLFSLSSGPMPFKGSTTISFRLPGYSAIRLQVLDARGRLIRELANGPFPAGLSKVAWNGMDSRGRAVAPGLYLYRLSSGGNVLTSKTILTK